MAKSLTKQLLEAQEVLNDCRNANAVLEEQVAKLQADIKSKIQTLEIYQSRSSKYETELEELHVLLDGLDGAPSRTYEVPNSWGGSQTKDRSLLVRMATWAGNFQNRKGV